MTSPPQPRPPEPMATIWIARKPGAKPVDVIVGEAEAERAIADLSAALAAIRAGKQAIADMTAPRGGHPYPAGGVVDAVIYCGATEVDGEGNWRTCEREDGHPGSHHVPPDGDMPGMAWSDEDDRPLHPEDPGQVTSRDVLLSALADMERCEAPDEDGRWHCTLQRGHAGKHFSLTGDMAYAGKWWADGEPPADADDDFEAIRELDAATRGDYSERGQA